MNFSMGYSTGNHLILERKSILLVRCHSYNNQTEYYIEAIDNYFNTNTNLDVYALDSFRTQRGEIGINNIILSGLGGLSYRTDQSKFKLTMMHIQNGEKKLDVLDKKIDLQTL